MTDTIKFEVGVWYEGIAEYYDGENNVQFFPSIKIVKRTDSTVWCVSEYDDTVYRRKIQRFQYLTEPYKGKTVEMIAIKDLDNARFYSTHRCVL